MPLSRLLGECGQARGIEIQGSGGQGQLSGARPPGLAVRDEGVVQRDVEPEEDSMERAQGIGAASPRTSGSDVALSGGVE